MLYDVVRDTSPESIYMPGDIVGSENPGFCPVRGPLEGSLHLVKEWPECAEKTDRVISGY